MGVVADFVSVPAGAWPEVLCRLRAAGVTPVDEAVERGVRYVACTRGRCRVGLGYSPRGLGWEVCVYCPAWAWWRRPLGTWRLMRDVRRAAG